MARTPPCRPRLTWQENNALQSSSSAPLQNVETSVVPMMIHAEWLPIYENEEDTVNFISAFLCDAEEQESSEKLKFLECIGSLCRATKNNDSLRGFNVVEKIKELIEEYCADPQLQLKLWQKAMCAIIELSFLPGALEGNEMLLLQTCLSAVTSFFVSVTDFYMIKSISDLCSLALETLDVMMEKLVGIIPVPRLNQELTDVFQTLLNLTGSWGPYVCERALGRIKKLIHLLTNPTPQVPDKESRSTGSPVCFKGLQIPLLGRLVGHLFVAPYSSKRMEHLASEILHCLINFIRKQRSRSMANDAGEQSQEDLEDISVIDFLTIRDEPMIFARYLDPVERTDIVCVAIEALSSFSVFDKNAARNILDVALSAPESWLMGVPNLIRCIHANMGGISIESHWQRLEALLLLVAKHHLTELVSALMDIPSARYSLAMPVWQVLFSVSKVKERVLLELFEWHQKKPIPLLGTLPEESKFLRLLAKIIENLLTEDLEHGREDEIVKALVTLQNILGHLKKKEASSITVHLVEKLLPLFHHRHSQVREQAIKFFTEQLESVVWSHKREMRDKVRTALFPFIVRMRDETPGVAEASQEGLLAAAKFLGWKLPRCFVEEQTTWIITQYLLKQDKKRVEGYVNQSLQYIHSREYIVQETAVMFLAVAAEHLKALNPEKMSEIMRGLELLRSDASPTIQNITRTTMHLLGSQQRNQGAEGFLRRIFCCWG